MPSNHKQYSYDILSKKLELFEGVFGAWDIVLGAAV